MIRNTFNSMPLTPIRGKVDKIKKNYKNLKPNATTDLTKIPLVGSCLLRYGRVRCYAIFDWNNFSSRVNYKFELVVDNRKDTMVYTFLSHLMSIGHSKKHDLFVLGTEKR